MQTNPVAFLKEVKAELLQVSWPSREETMRLTGVVIIISLAVGLILGLADYLLTNGMTLILRSGK